MTLLLFSQPLYFFLAAVAVIDLLSVLFDAVLPTDVVAAVVVVNANLMMQ